jgi:hypothetical protein
MLRTTTTTLILQKTIHDYTDNNEHKCLTYHCFAYSGGAGKYRLDFYWCASYVNLDTNTHSFVKYSKIHKRIFDISYYTLMFEKGYRVIM